jgi:hypothetical protein
MTSQLQVLECGSYQTTLRQTTLPVWGVTAIWDLSVTPAGNITLSEALIGQWMKTTLNGILPESITRGF